MDILPLAWAFIIAFCIVMYVLLDGFTLGIGVLLPVLNQHERNIAMSVLLPTWDGNQTWLVLGGASLYGAFPIAFSLLLPLFYLPLFIMVLCLLFRGVVFEFRLKAGKEKSIWDWIFACSSLLVTLIQGFILGNFICGFKLIPQAVPQLMANTHLLNFFNLFTAIGLALGYCLLGANRLILKTEGSIQQKMYKVAYICLFGVVFGLLVATIWTPLINSNIAERWYHSQHWVYLMILPYLSGIVLVLLLLALYKREDILPFWLAVFLFLFAYIGLLISFYPYIVPFQLTAWQAASSRSSLMFLLFGAIIMIPILLVYTGYSYHIFRGKVKDVFEY